MSKSKDIPYLAVHMMIDKSGSMCENRDRVIKGFNDFLGALQGSIMPPTLSVDTFEHGCAELIKPKPVQDIKKMTERDYCPSGGTALWSSIREAIAKLDAIPGTKKVLVILTDGTEAWCASADRTAALVKDRIENQGWTFIFIGVSIPGYPPDAFFPGGFPALAGKLNIDNILSLDNNKKIAEAMWAAASLSLRSGEGKVGFSKEELAKLK